MSTSRNVNKIPSRIGFALLLVLPLWWGGSALLSGLMGKYLPQLLQSGWGIWLANDIPLYFFGVPVFLLMLRDVPDGPKPQRTPMRMNPLIYFGLLIFSLGTMYAFSLGTQSLLDFFNLGNHSNGGPILEYLDNSTPFINFLFAVLLPSVGEEFLFRYMLLRKMRGCADSTYIFLSAFCFGLFHANISQIPYAFALGLIFGWLYLNTTKLAYTISLHFIINLIGVVVMPMLPDKLGKNGLAYLGMAIVAIMLAAFLIGLIKLGRVREGFLPATEPGWPTRKGSLAQNTYTQSINAGQIYSNEAQTPTPHSPTGWGSIQHSASPAAYSPAPQLAPPSKGTLRFCLLNPGIIMFTAAVTLMVVLQLTA